jgi:hypothetical protein
MKPRKMDGQNTLFEEGRDEYSMLIGKPHV